MQPTDKDLTRGRPEKYPWDLILNGTKWLMEYGVDFTCDPSHFRERAYLVAKQRGIRISCHLAGTNIVIRALIEELKLPERKQSEDVDSQQKEE